MSSSTKGRRPPAPQIPQIQRYELHRDGDRELHFDGTEMASIESGGSESGGIVHRAAVYRTRGGKYVAEFSSRPAPTRHPYHDPPADFPSPEELADYREQFISAVIDTAEWREGKARQFPQDTRNSWGAESLRKLASVLGDISATDQRWVSLWLAEYNLDVDDDERFIIVGRQMEVKSESLRTYGFLTGGRDPTSLDARSFLDEILNALKEAAQPEAPARPSGKAQAFETLDEALKWFRPGPLTTNLLKMLGRMDPEFID